MCACVLLSLARNICFIIKGVTSVIPASLWNMFLHYTNSSVYLSRFYKEKLRLKRLLFIWIWICFLFSFVLDCLLVYMAQNNTKLCDFSNTNKNDFISTLIAPITNAESCEINSALLNLVMKDQFSGLPSEDVATHLNNFVDL